MKLNISRQMAQATVGALLSDVGRGIKTYGKGDYQITNEEALEFFETVLQDETRDSSTFLSERKLQEAA